MSDERLDGPNTEIDAALTGLFGTMMETFGVDSSRQASARTQTDASVYRAVYDGEAGLETRTVSVFRSPVKVSGQDLDIFQVSLGGPGPKIQVIEMHDETNIFNDPASGISKTSAMLAEYQAETSGK